ncbi:MAG: hypothetical protein K9M96_16755 [Deltaproteobacteria bacterium]|nr:hypothetical protein [Deltaproteobacteria bacterium]
MKIKVAADKIVKGVQKLEGVEIVVENPQDAREGIDLILDKTGIKKDLEGTLKDIKTTAFQSYETSAVDYKMMFLLEFVFEGPVPLDTRVSAIRGLQSFLEKA